MKFQVPLVKSSLILLVFSWASIASAYHYGTAGCGIGSLAFKDKPGKIQIVAATLNDLVIPQTFAISSGTSGCKDTKESSAQLFFDTNKNAILTEIAIGTGETLDGISKIYGCTQPGLLNSTLKKHFYSTVKDEVPTPDVVRYGVETLIKKNKNLNQSCKEMA